MFRIYFKFTGFVVDFLFIVTPIVGVCNCSVFCCTLVYVNSSIAIILMGKRELVAVLNLSSWCLVVVGWLLLPVPWSCLQFVIVVFSDHSHLLFLTHNVNKCTQAGAFAECKLYYLMTLYFRLKYQNFILHI